METRRKNLPRLKRKPGAIPMDLQDDDIEMLRFVNSNRLLTSKQIQYLMPNKSNDVVLRRLQKLFHNNYLDRVKTGLYEPCVYGLGREGGKVLNVRWNKKNKDVSVMHVKHTLMVSNFRAVLESALVEHPGAKIDSWIPDGGFKEKVHFKLKDPNKIFIAPVIPDSTITLVINGDKKILFLEADRSNMSHRRFLHKMRGYWNYWDQIKKGAMKGPRAFRVLVVAKTEKRKKNLRALTKKADRWEVGSPMFWFTSEEKFSLENPKSVLDPIWQTPSDDRLHHILE